MSAVPSLDAASRSPVAPGDASSLTERLPRRHLLKFLGALPLVPPAPPRAGQPRPLAPIVCNAPRIIPEVAVSIDDGWDPYWVGHDLDILDAFDLKVTLFPMGAVARQTPACGGEHTRPAMSLATTPSPTTPCLSLRIEKFWPRST